MAHVDTALRLACAAWCMLPSFAHARVEPSFAVRERVLKSLVQVTASHCSDGSRRAGSGFVLESSDTVITAHHVVGGCATILVRYEGAPAGTPSKPAALEKVLPRGDLALLSVPAAPAVPALKLAPPPPDRKDTFAGLGYQNGQLSGGDMKVTFSTGATKLAAILTAEVLRELRDLGSPIDTEQQVLRFNMALQPGMSGGPIVDANGEVIGVVAGGLKAGAAPASWGWPATWIVRLKTSTASVATPVSVGKAYYTQSDLEAAGRVHSLGRTIRCGELALRFRGTHAFQDLMRGTDDFLRVQHIMNISTMSLEELNALQFDVWTHEGSGATAVMPAGYPVSQTAGVCRLATPDGQFRQVVWGALALNPAQVSLVSSRFEQEVMAPLVPNFGFQFDPQLTTLVAPGVPGPNFRPNGLVFNRKGFVNPKVPYFGPATPIMHTFETLIANAGTFLGVGTLNNQVTMDLGRCQMIGMGDPSCAETRAHVHDWTHFILATQLSTYPLF